MSAWPRRNPVRAAATRLYRTAVGAARLFGLLPRSRPPATGIHSILVVHLNPQLGDAVMLQPMLALLRQAQPDTEVTLVVDQRVAALHMFAPVDRIIALDTARRRGLPWPHSLTRIVGNFAEFRRALRGLRPDVALVPRWGDDLYRSAALAYLTAAPRRIGFAASVGGAHGSDRDALFTEVIHAGHGLHESARFAELLYASGLAPRSMPVNLDTVPALTGLAQSIDGAALRARLGLAEERPFVALAPGAGHPRRIWPSDRWAALAQGLQEAGLTVVSLAGPHDAPLTAAITRRTPAVLDLAGRIDLLETVALLSMASACIGADSGPGHIAGALGVPTLTLYIATPDAPPDHVSAPSRIHPLGPSTCGLYPANCIAPCVRVCTASVAHCILTIRPEAVLAEALSMLRHQNNFV